MNKDSKLTWLDKFSIINKEIRYGHLSTDVAELGSDTPEKSVLFAERLVRVPRIKGGPLDFPIGHVAVGDFRNWGKIEDNRKEEDESSDPQVGILH